MTTGRRDEDGIATPLEKGGNDPGRAEQITYEMVAVAAELLLAESALDLMTEGWPEDIARRMLERALAKCPGEKSESDRLSG